MGKTKLKGKTKADQPTAVAAEAADKAVDVDQESSTFGLNTHPPTVLSVPDAINEGNDSTPRALVDPFAPLAEEQPRNSKVEGAAGWDDWYGGKSQTEIGHGANGWGESPTRENFDQGGGWDIPADNIGEWVANTANAKSPPTDARSHLNFEDRPRTRATSMIENEPSSHHGLHRSATSVSRNPPNPYRTSLQQMASANDDHGPQINQYARAGLASAAPALSTIHSERSLHTLGHGPDPSLPANTRQPWLPNGRFNSILNPVTPTATNPQSAFSRAGNTRPSAISAYLSSPKPKPETQTMYRVDFQESGGEALQPALGALFGLHRPAEKRIHWTFSPQHNYDVANVLHWIDNMAYGLASLGLHKYISTGERGVLLCNAEYRCTNTPEEPAFDWISFEQARGTLDKTFQEAIATYDPATTALVYVFLLSHTRNSVGLWRKKLPIPPEIREMNETELRILEKRLAGKKHVVAVEKLPSGYMNPPTKGPGNWNDPKSGFLSSTYPRSMATAPPVKSQSAAGTNRKVLTKATSSTSVHTSKARDPEKKRSWLKILTGGKK